MPWPATVVDGIGYPAGDSGFFGDGELASALLRTNAVANTEYIGYLGINDATTVGSSYWLRFNGMPFTTLTAANIASAVENYQYTFWGYEHFLYRGPTLTHPLAGAALTVSQQFENQLLNSDANVSGISLFSMRATRSGDGGPITIGGYLPPNAVPVADSARAGGVLNYLTPASSVASEDLIQGSDGNFYGTASTSIFKLTPSGVLTTLEIGTNVVRASKLVQGNDGNLYGITSNTIFEITPSGVLTTLYTLGGNNYFSPPNLIQGSDGSFYGIYGTSTTFGAFKFTKSGSFTILATFALSDGFIRLIQGKDGNFYGITWTGGSANKGNIFKLTPSGVLTTLFTFDGTNGSGPRDLIQGSDGNFYGAAGDVTSAGRVFKFTPSGSFTTLASFGSIGNPLRLIEGNNGNFYGITLQGAIFELTPSGTLTGPVHFSLNQRPVTLVRSKGGDIYAITADYRGALAFILVFTPTP